MTKEKREKLQQELGFLINIRRQFPSISEMADMSMEIMKICLSIEQRRAQLIEILNNDGYTRPVLDLNEINKTGKLTGQGRTVTQCTGKIVGW